MKKRIKITKLGFRDYMSKAKTIQLVATVCLLIIGAGLLIAGFVVKPIGEIHNTVLISFGEILTFVGAIFGIDYTYKYKQTINKGKEDQDQ